MTDAPFVNFPLRVILALLVVEAVTAIGGWGLITVLRIKSMTQTERMMAASGIVLVMTALAAWVVLWPAYWD
jgi:hypothetical protein